MMRNVLFALALGLAAPATVWACDCQKKQAPTACDCPGQSCPGECPGMQDAQKKPEAKKKPDKPKRS